MSVQPTSREAYQQTLPSHGTQKAQIMEFLVPLTKYGMDATNKEIELFTKLPINVVTARVNSLREEDGAVELSRERVCTVTGFRALAWRAKT